MDGLIVRLKELNAELVPCYYALEYEADIVDEKEKDTTRQRVKGRY